MHSSAKRLLIVDERHEWSLYSQAFPVFHLVFAENSEQALALLHKGAFDLALFSDRMSSKKMLELIRLFNQNTRSYLPIIIVLDRGNEKLAVASLKEGVADNLIREELIASIAVRSVTRAIENKKWEKIYAARGESASPLTDSLTGLYSVFYMKTRLGEEIQRSNRFQYPLTLMVFHIDQFDQISKKYGAEAGNKILKDMARLFANNLRSSDLLARLEEDFFALLLPHTNVEESQTVWNRLSEKIGEYPFVLGKDNLMIHLNALIIPLAHKTTAVFRGLDDIKLFTQKHFATRKPVQILEKPEDLESLSISETL